MPEHARARAYGDPADHATLTRRESAVVLLIYLNAALQSAAFAEKATICKNIVYLLASAAIMIWMLEYYQNRSRVCA
jgi:hypothetical protein